MSASAVSGPARSAATTLARGTGSSAAPSRSLRAPPTRPPAGHRRPRPPRPGPDPPPRTGSLWRTTRSFGSAHVVGPRTSAPARWPGARLRPRSGLTGTTGPRRRPQTVTTREDDERGRRERTTTPPPTSSSGPAGPDVPAPTRCRTALVETDGRDDVRARRLDRVHDVAAGSPLGRRSSLPEVWTGRAGADTTTVSRPPSRPTSEPRDFGAEKYGHAPPSGPAWRRSTRSPYSAR